MLDIDKSLKRALSTKKAPSRRVANNSFLVGARQLPSKIFSNDRLMKKFLGDKDKDGVKNVFDCKPYNKKRQDFMLETTVPIVDYPESYGYRKRTVMMTPDEYMRAAWISHGAHRRMPLRQYEKESIFPENLQRIKEGLRIKEKVVPAPYLETKRGVYEQQEGRHRAVAARELGIKTIPVHIIETDKDYIYEQEQKLKRDSDNDGVIDILDAEPNRR